MLKFALLLQSINWPANSETIRVPSQLCAGSHCFSLEDSGSTGTSTPTACTLIVRDRKGVPFPWALSALTQHTTRWRCGLAKEGNAPCPALNHQNAHPSSKRHCSQINSVRTGRYHWPPPAKNKLLFSPRSKPTPLH